MTHAITPINPTASLSIVLMLFVFYCVSLAGPVHGRDLLSSSINSLSRVSPLTSIHFFPAIMPLCFELMWKAEGGIVAKWFGFWGATQFVQR